MKSIVQVFGALALLASAAPAAQADEPCGRPVVYQPAPVAYRPVYRTEWARSYREAERREAWRRAEAYRRWRAEEWREHHRRFRPY